MSASREPNAPKEPIRDDSWRGRLWRGVASLDVDRAIAYSLLARGWQFIAGPITLVLIARYFSPELQGYFYTFASLMGLQILFEMGLHSVVINTASHEWAQLGSGDGSGSLREPLMDRGAVHNNVRMDRGAVHDNVGMDRGAVHDNVHDGGRALERLVSFGRQCLRWYAAASLLFLIVIGSCGWWFMGGRELSANEWSVPWWVLVCLTAGQLWTMPLISILEGCNQVLAVYRLRAFQAVLGNVVVWAVIVGGGGLWAAAGSAAVKLGCEVFLVAWTYRSFFRPFWERPTTAAISWRTEVWPLQWSLALHSILQYLAYFMFAPILFHFHGSTVAGQMGMTWTVLTTMQYAAFSWVQTRAPKLGMLVARREFSELDRVFFRAAGISCAVLLIGCVGYGLAVAVLPHVPHPWAQRLSLRLLPIESTCLFSGSVFLIGVFQCLVSYLLAHKRNPLLPVSVIGNLATIGGVVVGGACFGATGAGAALLIVLLCWTLPAAIWVWRSCRSDWNCDGVL